MLCLITNGWKLPEEWWFDHPTWGYSGDTDLGNVMTLGLSGASKMIHLLVDIVFMGFRGSLFSDKAISRSILDGYKLIL